MGSVQTYRGIQTYRGCPEKGDSKHMVVPKQTGGIETYGECLNIWGMSKHTGVIQTCVGGVQTYGECQNIQEASKHIGGVQTYGGHPDI